MKTSKQLMVYLNRGLTGIHVSYANKNGVYQNLNCLFVFSLKLELTV